MGTFNHQVVVVIGENEDVKKAQEKAKQIYPYVSEVINGGFNGKSSFMLGCDGSKEGWSESDLMDSIRKSFMKWLDCSERYLHYAEIYFHEDRSYEPSFGRTSHSKYEEQEDHDLPY